LVAAEVRYPFSPKLASEGLVESFLERLGGDVPIAEPMSQPVLEVTVATHGQAMPTAVPQRSVVRFLSKARDMAVTVSGGSTIIETTRYKRFEEFRALLERVFEALAEYGPPIGVERLGLRYIDEIRLNGHQGRPADWRGYIQDSLLASADLVADAVGDAGLEPETWEGIVHFSGLAGRWLALRYGALQGQFVNPGGPLRFPTHSESGPFFLMDLDSYRVSDPLDDYSVEQLIRECDELHRPIRAVFEHAITDRLRNEVLRKQEGR